MSVMVGLNMCDWISCSSPVVLHVPSPLAGLQGVRGAQPPGIAGGPGGAAPRYGRGSGGRSPQEWQGVRGAQPPGKAGGFGGPPGPPIIAKK